MSVVSLPLRETRQGRVSQGEARFSIGDGRSQMVNRVADLVHRRGHGRFFVSGYSGVGKSTFVRQVIADLQFRLARDTDRQRFVLRVDLTGYNLDDVHAIGRQLTLELHWEIQRTGLKLTRVARQRLLRVVEGVTAKTVELVQGRIDNIEPKVEVKGPLGAVGLGGRREHHREHRAAFDGFNVPITLLELSNLIRDIPRSFQTVERSWWSRLFGGRAALPEPVIVVTIDRVANWDVVCKLADLFSTPNVAFLVVIPLPVRRAWLEGQEAGKEDVPTFQDIYVPCLWDEIEALVESMLDVDRIPERDRHVVPKLTSFLAFQSNGIPKRCEDLLFNYIDPMPDGRFLRLSDRDLADIEFCSDLYDVIRRRERDILGELFDGVTQSSRDHYRRVAIAAVRQFASQGSIKTADYSHTVVLALETMSETEREHIVRRVLEVLQDEHFAVRVGDTVTLSHEARQMAARGHTVLVKALLPVLSGGPPEATPVGTMLVPLARLDEGFDADVVAEQAKTKLPAPEPPTEPKQQEKPAREPSHTGSMQKMTQSRPPPTPMDLFERQVADTLRDQTAGEYEIIGLLGKGGMSVVYEARDISLDRLVAIKVLPPSLTVDQGVMERFQQEARTSASLNHPNIVPIYSIRASGGLFWFSMMLVEGHSMRALIEKRAPVAPTSDVARVLLPVARALDYAHERNVIHRDIKPENIVEGPLGEYLLMDFGIAKALAAPENLTGTGMAIGTPRYMAPEQAMGTTVSGATDQYGLGVVAYELLTGKLPFDDENPVSLLHRHLHDPVPSAHLSNPAVSEAASAAVGRALAKQPEDRFESVTTFVEALGV